jgi:hypothetical protein
MAARKKASTSRPAKTRSSTRASSKTSKTRGAARTKKPRAASRTTKPKAATKKAAPKRKSAATSRANARDQATKRRARRPAEIEQPVDEPKRTPPPQPKPPPAPVHKKHPSFTDRRSGDLFRPGAHVGQHSPADDRIPQQNFLRGQMIKDWARGRTEPRRYKQRSRRRRSQDAGGYRPSSARGKDRR